MVSDKLPLTCDCFSSGDQFTACFTRCLCLRERREQDSGREREVVLDVCMCTSQIVPGSGPLGTRDGVCACVNWSSASVSFTGVLGTALWVSGVC